MRIAKAIVVAAVALATTLSFAQPSQAAQAPDGAKAAATATIGTQRIEVSSLAGLGGQFTFHNGRYAAKPGAPAQVQRFVAAANTVPQKSRYSKCTNRMRVAMVETRVYLLLPDCLLHAAGEIVSAGGAMAALLSVVGLTNPVIDVIVAAVVAAALGLVAKNAWCEITEDDNHGVEVTVTIMRVRPPMITPPYAFCWTS